MRYFYIICLVLSSFFIYNQSSAENSAQKLAFFIPTNAYQKNTNVKSIDTLRPRYAAPQTQATSEEEENNPTQTSSESSSRAQKITLPFVRKPIKEATETKEVVETPQQPSLQQAEVLTDGAPKKDTLPLPPPPSSNIIDETPSPIEEVAEMPDDIKEKVAKYNIDEDFTISFSPKLSDFKKEDKPKTIKEMLTAIPYPDLEAPKFKQAYGRYGITLRTFYRKKEMPTDYDQDEILAKANSSKRFLVEDSSKKSTKF